MEYQKRQCRKSDRKKRTGASRRDSEYEEEKKVKEVKRKRGRMWVKEEKGGGEGMNLAGCVLHGTQRQSPSSSCSSAGNTDANAR